MSRTGSPTIDESEDDGARAADRLRSSRVIWMATVSEHGVPQASPVWYLWDGGDFTIYSRESPRHDNVRKHPAVGLHLDGNGLGGDIVVIEGLARVDHSLPAVPDHEAYLRKYGEVMAQRGWTAQWFWENYPVPLSITPTRFRYW